MLRLLLDSCLISPRASKDQLASVAKFVQGSASHTSHIRTTSITVDLEESGGDFTLSLIDTPSLDFKDDSVTERSIAETLRFIEGRLGEAADPVRPLSSLLPQQPFILGVSAHFRTGTNRIVWYTCMSVSAPRISDLFLTVLQLCLLSGSRSNYSILYPCTACSRRPPNAH